MAKRNGLSKNNEYGITLVSLDEKFREEYEPKAVPFKKRIEALRYLHSNGFKTWVSMEPYPTPNIIQQYLNEVLEAVSFVDRIVFGRLNYSAKSSEFKYAKGYYNSLVLSVIKFCKKHKIDYHIKQGTQSDVSPLKV